MKRKWVTPPKFNVECPFFLFSAGSRLFRYDTRSVAARSNLKPLPVDTHVDTVD